MRKKGRKSQTKRGVKRYLPYPCPDLGRRGMSEQETNSNGDVVKDFQSTGRTGRRNALADVLGANKEVSTSDVPLKLEKLSLSDAAACSESKDTNCVTNSGTESNSTGRPPTSNS